MNQFPKRWLLDISDEVLVSVHKRRLNKFVKRHLNGDPGDGATESQKLALVACMLARISYTSHFHISNDCELRIKTNIPQRYTCISLAPVGSSTDK